ncbi:MAG: cation:proton antiporter [Dehalococcoidia bacterium]
MEHGDVTQIITTLALQLAVILVAAKLGAELFERFLKQPAVLGELMAGVVISPFALGGIPLPGIGPVFPPPPADSGIPVSTTLYAFGQIAALVLLFVAGLETNFGTFLKFGPAAALVAVGGVIVPFVLGDLVTVWFGLATGPADPPALFLGALLTATSVGITARVLSDIGKLDTPEGVTILGAAVIDDVLGILVLAIVVALGAGAGFSMLDVGIVGARAMGIWLVLTGALAVASISIARFVAGFRSQGAGVALALALALISGYVAQSAGLALIIGAYSAGLALSRAPLKHQLDRDLRPVYHALVPVFFVVMGMLVDFRAMAPLLGFGAVVTLVAILGKIAGCSLPALLVGFRPIGAIRIGIGMLPRGEVALVVAGVGLTSGVIGTDLFGVAILMTLVTTLLAPAVLVPAFSRGGPGRTVEHVLDRSQEDRIAQRKVIVLPAGVFEIFLRQLGDTLAEKGFELAIEVGEPTGAEVRELRRGDEVVSLRWFDTASGVQLEIEAESVDWPALCARAVDQAAAETAASLVSLLADVPERSHPAELLNKA